MISYLGIYDRLAINLTHCKSPNIPKFRARICRSWTYCAMFLVHGLPLKANMPSRMGLQASLPPLRVLNFQWKISLHRSNNSVSVSRTNLRNSARSALASEFRYSMRLSHSECAAPSVLSTTRTNMIKTEKVVAHLSALLLALCIAHIRFPQSLSMVCIRNRCMVKNESFTWRAAHFGTTRSGINSCRFAWTSATDSSAMLRLRCKMVLVICISIVWRSRSHYISLASAFKYEELVLSPLLPLPNTVGNSHI